MMNNRYIFGLCSAVFYRAKLRPYLWPTAGV